MTATALTLRPRQDGPAKRDLRARLAGLDQGVLIVDNFTTVARLPSPLAILAVAWAFVIMATVQLFADAELGERVPWAAGTISRFAAVRARVMETWIHAWDIRHPAGLVQPLDDRAWWVVDLAVRSRRTR